MSAECLDVTAGQQHLDRRVRRAEPSVLAVLGANALQPQGGWRGSGHRHSHTRDSDRCARGVGYRRKRIEGNFDWPGLSIANFVLRSVGALPWRMAASDYVPQGGKRLTGVPIVASWDPALMPRMAALGQVLEEEAVVDQLFGDLRVG